MRLTADRAELASAATDLLLVAIAATGVLRVPRAEWRAALALAAIAALAGSLIHGLEWPERDASPLWWEADLALAGALACLGAAAARDRLGAARARQTWAPLALAALAAASVSRALPSTFAPLLAFQAAVVGGAGVSWFGLARSGRRPGARALAGGCAVALLAGAIGASGLRVDPGWPLDANALFHLVQAAAVLLWIRGARTAAIPARA